MAHAYRNESMHTAREKTINHSSLCGMRRNSSIFSSMSSVAEPSWLRESMLRRSLMTYPPMVWLFLLSSATTADNVVLGCCWDGCCLWGDFPFFDSLSVLLRGDFPLVSVLWIDFPLASLCVDGVVAEVVFTSSLGASAVGPSSFFGVEPSSDLELSALWERSPLWGVLSETPMSTRSFFFCAEETLAFKFPLLSVWEDMFEAHDVECAMIPAVLKVVLVPTDFVSVFVLASIFPSFS
mmetsp:Transcript_17554/g.28374  ORF Transcript_17554/g.28374 Transcript_17554/m.28374 type:complete len:238 (+) Transcript_17554:2289-3002(+)